MCPVATKWRPLHKPCFRVSLGQAFRRGRACVEVFAALQPHPRPLPEERGAVAYTVMHARCRQMYCFSGIYGACFPSGPGWVFSPQRNAKPGPGHRANAEIVTPSPDLHHHPSAIHGGIFVAKR